MKMMEASKRHEDLYWFQLEPYVQSQRRSSAYSLLECSEVLTMGGCKNGERDGRTYARRRAARREAPGALLLWRMTGMVEDVNHLPREGALAALI